MSSALGHTRFVSTCSHSQGGLSSHSPGWPSEAEAWLGPCTPALWQICRGTGATRLLKYGIRSRWRGLWRWAGMLPGPSVGWGPAATRMDSSVYSEHQCSEKWPPEPSWSPHCQFSESACKDKGREEEDLHAPYRRGWDWSSGGEQLWAGGMGSSGPVPPSPPTGGTQQPPGIFTFSTLPPGKPNSRSSRLT